MSRNHQATVLEAIRRHRGTMSDESLVRATGLDRMALASAVGSLRRRGIIAYEKINPTKADWSTIRIIEQGEAQQLVVEEVAPPIVARAYVDTAALSRVRDLLAQAAEQLGAIVGGALAPAEYLRALASQLEVEPSPVATRKPAPPLAKRVKSFRCEDGMGNELARFATLAEARKHADDALDVVVIVDEAKGRVVFERDADEAAEEE